MPPARRSPDIMKMIKFPEINPMPDKYSYFSTPSSFGDDDNDVKIRVESRILCVNRDVLCKSAFGFIKILQAKPYCSWMNLPNQRFVDVYELLQCIVPSPFMKKIDESNAFRLASLVNEYNVPKLHGDIDRFVIRYIDRMNLPNEEMVDLLLFCIENNLPESIRKIIIRCAFISTQQCHKLVQINQKKYEAVVFYLLHIVKQQIDTFRKKQRHQILYNVVYSGTKDGKKCESSCCSQNGRLFYCQICKKYFCSAHCAGCDNCCTHCSECTKEIPPKFASKFEPGINYCLCAIRLSNKMIGRLIRSNVGEKVLKILTSQKTFKKKEF